MRELTVGVAVTPDFQQLPDWKGTFKKRLRYASSIFEREFRIKLKDVIFWTWQPQHPELGTRSMLDELMNTYSLAKQNTDIIIGLTRLTDISESLNVRDLHVLGRTRPFSGYTLLRYPNHPLFRIQEETILIHELGHLFGAMHTDKSDTIMAPYADRQIPTTFDPENRKIFAATRNMDFRQGTFALEPGIIQQLLDAYNRMAVSDQPSEFYYALAKFYLKLGDNQNALFSLQRLNEMDPGDPQVLYDLGILYHRTGDEKKAIKLLSDAISKGNPDVDRKHLASCYNALGAIYFRTGNMQGAHYAWGKSLALNPDDQETKVNLAIVQLQEGQVSSAEHELKKALEKDPENVKVMIHLARASYVKQKYQDAVSLFQSALNILDAKSRKGTATDEDRGYLSDIYAGLGSAYWMLKDKNTSVSFFDRACRTDPSRDCKEKLGRIYFELEQYDNAINMLMEALKDRKESPELYGIIGVAFSKKGNYENAISAFQEGLRYVEDPGTASKLHSNSGNLLMQLQKPDAALSEFMSAISKDWKNVDAHFGMALAYLAKGQAQDAKQSLLQVLSLDPSNQKAREVLVQTEQIIQQMQQSQEVTFQFK